MSDTDNTLSRLESLRRSEKIDHKNVHVEILTQAIEQIEVLTNQLAEEREQTLYYKAEWEAACERDRYGQEQLADKEQSDE